jgi:hypothetical protein
MPPHPAARPSDPAARPTPNRLNPNGSAAGGLPARPAIPPGRAQARGPEAVSDAVTTMSSPAKDLTVNKILAGAGAAATSAILGSLFGAAGTVAGAALGSVASTVAATIYQRYLDRTRDTLVARIRPVGRRGAAATGTTPSELTLPMQRSPEGQTVRMRVEPVVPPSAAPSRHRWLMWAGATVLVFVIGLLAVTGIEWAKGSTLTSNQSGTSVGRVFGADHGTSTESTTEPTTAPTTAPNGSTFDSTAAPTATPDPTAGPSSTASPGQDGSSSGSQATNTPSTGSNRSPSGATTNSPALGGLFGSGAGARG